MDQTSTETVIRKVHSQFEKLIMKENVGPKDRTIRSILGPALVALGTILVMKRRSEWPGIAAMVGGALITENAITRVCPMLAALGIRRTP